MFLPIPPPLWPGTFVKSCTNFNYFFLVFGCLWSVPRFPQRVLEKTYLTSPPVNFVTNLLLFSRHHSLLHWLDQNELKYITADDDENIKANLSKLWFIRKIFHKIFTTGLEIGAFSLQFCEWWLSRSDSGPNVLTNLPVPLPPTQNGFLSKIWQNIKSRWTERLEVRGQKAILIERPLKNQRKIWTNKM